MSLELRSNYWHDSESKNAFMEYIKQIFGLDFRLWHDAGFWDDCYQPFSYFEDGKIVSSVCLYSLNMMVNGRVQQVSQISGVGTVLSRRNQGLNKQLTEIAMQNATKQNKFVFLFSSKLGTDYYKKTGFKSIAEHRVSIAAPRFNGFGLSEKLSMTDPRTLQKIFNLASERKPVSDVLGIVHPKLFMYHVLYTMKDCTYYIKALDALVCFTRKDGHLTVFDIVCRRDLTFSEVYPFIASEGDLSIEFRFMTDKLNLKEFEVAPYADSNVFVRGSFPFRESEFIFPFTAQA